MCVSHPEAWSGLFLHPVALLVDNQLTLHLLDPFIKLSKSPLYSPLPSEGTKVWRGDTGGGGEEVGFFIEVLTKDLHKDGDDGLEGNQWLSGNQLTLFHLVSTTTSTTAH